MSRAAKERIGWVVALAAALLACLAPAAEASLPRSVDDPALRAAIAQHSETAASTDRDYRLLARASTGYGLLPREPACIQQSAYSETRVRASGFLVDTQHQGTRQLSLDLAVGVCDGPSMYQFAGYDPVNNGDPLGLQTEEKKEEEGCFDSFAAAWGCITEPFVRAKNTAKRWAEHHDQHAGGRRDPADTGLDRVAEQTRLTGELAGDTFDAGMRAADISGAGGLVTVVYRTATRTVTKQVGKHLVRRLVENGWEVVDDDLAEAAGRRVARGALATAQQGGKHAGFLRNYAGRSRQEIERGIVSIEKQIAKHNAKIADPERYLPNFRQLDPRQQEALLTKKWPGDIQRQQEQLEILRGLLDGPQ